MDQLIPSLATLVESFRGCFHPQVFPTFQALLAGWIVCQAHAPSARSGSPPVGRPGGTMTPPTPSSTRRSGSGTTSASSWPR